VSADAQLSEAEIFSLILAPGFSTARKITDVSGRGVGMDVVRRSVEAYGEMSRLPVTPASELPSRCVCRSRLPSLTDSVGESRRNAGQTGSRHLADGRVGAGDRRCQ
jgi:two-component system chemotaxis sensor kinase CheA